MTRATLPILAVVATATFGLATTGCSDWFDDEPEPALEKPEPPPELEDDPNTTAGPAEEADQGVDLVPTVEDNPYEHTPLETQTALAVDIDGVPLPPGASQRYGGTTLRHTRRVLDLAASPDLSTLLSAGADGTVEFWDTTRGERVRPALAHTAEVTAAAIAPAKPTRVVTAARDGRVRVWTLPEGRIATAIALERGALSALAVHPDGRLAAVGSDRGALLIVDLERAEVRFDLPGHDGTIEAVAFTPDGSALASLGLDGSLRIWEGKAFVPRIVVSDLATAGRHRIAFDSTGERVAVSGPDTQVIDARTGADVHSLPGESQADVSAVAFAPDDRLIATAAGRQLKLWDAETGAPAGTPLTLDATAPISSLLFIDDARVAVSQGRAVTLLDIDTERVVAEPDGHADDVTAVVVAPRGQLASAGPDGTVRFWDLDTAREANHIQLPGGASDLAMSPAGKRLAVAIPFARPMLIAVEGLAELPVPALDDDDLVGVNRAAFIAGGREVLFADDTGRAHIVDVSTGERTHTFDAGSGQTLDLAVSRDTMRVAISTFGGTTVVFDRRDLPASWPPAATGSGRRGSQTPPRMPGLLELPELRPRVGLAFGPRGLVLAAASTGELDAALELWTLERDPDAGLRVELASETWHVDPSTVAVSPDGGIVVIGQRDGSIAVAERRTGAVRIVLPGHEGAVRDAVFSADGQTLYTASDDTSILAWDLGNLRTYVAPFVPSDAVAPSPAIDEPDVELPAPEPDAPTPGAGDVDPPDGDAGNEGAEEPPTSDPPASAAPDATPGPGSGAMPAPTPSPDDAAPTPDDDSPPNDPGAAPATDQPEEP